MGGSDGVERGGRRARLAGEARDGRYIIRHAGLRAAKRALETDRIDALANPDGQIYTGQTSGGPGGVAKSVQWPNLERGGQTDSGQTSG